MQISSIGKDLSGNRRYKEGGFSLLELLIVLVIMGLVLSITSPLLTKGIDNIKLQTAVRELSATLRYARSMAVSEGKEQVLNMDIDTGKYWLNEKVSELRELPSDIRFININTGEKEVTTGKAGITFYPVGSSSGGVVWMGDQKRKYRLQVRLVTGVVEVVPEGR